MIDPFKEELNYYRMTNKTIQAGMVPYLNPIHFIELKIIPLMWPP